MPEFKRFHAPVLLKEVLDLLVTDKVKLFCDGTLGLGGHAEAVLESCPQIHFYLATDLDAQHLAHAEARLMPYASKLRLNLKNFSDLPKLLKNAEFDGLQKSILLDLGLCSNQLDDASKGFAFSVEGPLHMSFATESENTAEKLLNEGDTGELSQIFRDFGEEPQHYRIARKIAESRVQKSLRTTRDLRQVIESVVHPKDHKKVLTRVFQALRIAVNGELDHLQKFLSEILDQLESGDRLGIMSYHSLEDRLVKKHFKRMTTPITQADKFSNHSVVSPAEFKNLTRLVVPKAEEIANNPRARSAKFRVIEKI